MLHKDRENFEQIILKVSEDTGIDASIVEKDYYVTLFLKRIIEVIPNIIFKGGTSLSKCYKLIKRFSEDIDLNIEVETAVYIKAYPRKKIQATSIIYDYLHENGFDNLLEQYGLEPFEVNVQVAERTFIDKLYALGDYYLSGAISEHSRHIYDIYKLSEIVPLDDKLKALAKEVYIEREPHEQCRSAKPGVEVNKLLQEIIDVEAYKKDYEDITMKMLFEEVDYETAVSKLQQVVKYGLFE